MHACLTLNKAGIQPLAPRDHFAVQHNLGMSDSAILPLAQKEFIGFNKLMSKADLRVQHSIAQVSDCMVHDTFHACQAG